MLPELTDRLKEVAPNASFDDVGVIITSLRQGLLLVTNDTTGTFEIYRKE